MEGFEVYVAADKEMLSFDEALSGIRTLLQNQSNTSFLVKMKALTMAHMLIKDQDEGNAVKHEYVSNEVPWVSMQKKILDGGGVMKLNRGVNPLFTDDVSTCKNNTLASGTTSEYIDRLNEIKKSQGPDDLRTRRLATSMNPLALPQPNNRDALSGKAKHQTYDIDAVCALECASETHIPRVRLLAKKDGTPGDDVLHKGVAFLGDPSQPFVTFDLEKYLKHVVSLKMGDKVVVMLDVISSVSNQTMVTGKVIHVNTTKQVLKVKLDDGVTLEDDKNGTFEVDLTNPRHVIAFVYGSAWKDAIFCRSKLFHQHTPTTLVPTHLVESRYLPMIEPDVIHKALGLLVSSISPSMSSLIGTDDVSLDVSQKRRLEIIIEKQLLNFQEFLKKHNEVDTETRAFSGLSTHQSPSAFFTDVSKGLQDSKLTMKQQQKKQPHAKLKKDLKIQLGGRYKKDNTNDTLPLRETCVWAPSTILEGVDDGCDTGISNMLQGHVTALEHYDSTHEAITQHKSDVLKHRSEDIQTEIGVLISDVHAVDKNIKVGHARLALELHRVNMNSDRGRIAAFRDSRVSPFDIYHDHDLERWTKYLVRDSLKRGGLYMGDAQEAFEADLLNLRTAFDDLPHYREYNTAQEKPNKTDGGKIVNNPYKQKTVQGVISADVILLTLMESCQLQGVKDVEIEAVLRNVKQYLPEAEAEIHIRQKIELVKKAKNRPEFKEKRPQSRIALEKRLIDRVQKAAEKDYTIKTTLMIAALLVILLDKSDGRMTFQNSNPMINKINRKKLEHQDRFVKILALESHRLLVAILPSGDKELGTIEDFVKTIKSDIKEVEEDKATYGLELVTDIDLEHAFIHSRAVRDAPWDHFRPIMANISALGDIKLSRSLQRIAELQRPFTNALPMHRSEDNMRTSRYNMCCPYLVHDVQRTHSIQESALSSVGSKTLQQKAYLRPMTTILRGSTACIACPPAEQVQTIGVQPTLLAKQDYNMNDNSKSALRPGWIEDSLRQFLELNPTLDDDTILTRIVSLNTDRPVQKQDLGSQPTTRVAWSSLSSHTISRFEELCAKTAISKEHLDFVKAMLLSPTVSLDGSNLQEQQYHARNFLRSIVIPVFGRISNTRLANTGPDVDQETSRLIQLMRMHDPVSDVSTLQSLFSSCGNINGANLLMLAMGPTKVITTLRASVQLHMGVAISALWSLLRNSGGGPLGISIVRPTIHLCITRLVSSLKFSRADESITRLIQDQREDGKLRKIAIYERIAPEDIELVKEFRLIKKLDWDVIERDYAKDEITASLGRTDAETEKEREAEIGALGAYPDDDRDVEINDADQEMMDYAD